MAREREQNTRAKTHACMEKSFHYRFSWLMVDII